MKKLLLLLLIINVSSIFAQEDTISSSVNFDFGLTRNKNVNLWPIFKRSKTKTTTEISALANLIGYQNNQEYQLKHGHVLPLFFNTKTASSRDIRIGTTYYPSIFRYTEDQLKGNKTFSLGEIAPYIRFLQLSTSDNGLEVDNNLFFFIWYNKSEADKNTSFVTFPLVWYYKKPQSTYLTIAPIYSQGDFKGYNGSEIGSYKMITPLFWNFTNTEDTSSFLFPIYQNKTTGKTTSTTIYPLLFHRKVSPRKSSTTIFPLYNHTIKIDDYIGKTDLKMITPLFWTKDTKNSTSRTLLPVFNYYKDSLEEHFISPMYAFKKDSFSSFTMFTPLIWNIENKYDTTKIIAPFYISQKSRDQKVNFIPLLLAWKKTYKNTISYNQFPLLFTSNDTLHKIKKQSIALLFYHKKTNRSTITRLFPLFGYKKNENITRFISPIYINSKKSYSWDSSYTKAILPIYLKTGNEKRRFSTVFPVYWSFENANYKSIYLFPFGGSGKAKNEDRGFVNVTPLYWQIKQPNKTKKMVLPLWFSSIEFRKHWQNSKDSSLPKIDTIKTSVLFPILWSYHDNSAKNLTLFPFYWSRKNSYKTQKTIFPIYSKYDYNYSSNTATWKEKRRNYGMLLYHFKKQNTDNQHVNQTSKHGLFPFYFYKKESSFTYGLDTTIYKHTIVFPIYWSYYSKDKFDLNAKEVQNITSKKIIFPFYWRSKNPTETTTMFLPLFSYKKLNSHNKELYLAPMFHWKRTDLDTTFTLFPLFHYKNTVDVKRNYFAPFYYFEHNKIDKKTISAVTPLFWRIKKTDEHLGNQTIFFPFLWMKESRNDKEVHFLPFVHYKRNSTDTSLSILPLYFKRKSLGLKQTILLPLFYEKHDSIAQKNTLAITPFFWKIQQDHKKTSVFFPFIDYSKNSLNQDVNMGVLGFLFRYKSTQQEKSFKFLYPLIDFKKSNEKTTFRISPLFWMKKSTELSYNTFLPIYYHQKTLNSSYFNLLAGLYSRKTYYTDNEKSQHFLWSFIYHKKSDKGHSFRLGYFLYKNIETDTMIEKGVFPFYSFESNIHGKKSKSYLFKCFQSNELPIEGSNEKYKEIKAFWFIRIGSNYNYLHQKGLM